jgi:hypothetical protein
MGVAVFGETAASARFVGNPKVGICPPAETPLRAVVIGRAFLISGRTRPTPTVPKHHLQVKNYR